MSREKEEEEGEVSLFIVRMVALFIACALIVYAIALKLVG